MFVVRERRKHELGPFGELEPICVFVRHILHLFTYFHRL